MKKRTGVTEFQKRSFIEMMKDIGTSIPGHILSFDKVTQLAQLQIGVKKVTVDGDQVDMPPLIECCVYMFGGGDYFIESEINKGDEGVILFSQRCIDGWVNSGGVAENPILRFHDFSDAYFLPGLRSQPNKISNFENNGIRLRNRDASNYIWLKNDGTGEVKLDSLKIIGDIDQEGTFTSDTDIIASGKSLVNHTHSAGLLVDSTPAPVTGTTGTPT